MDVTRRVSFRRSFAAALSTTSSGSGGDKKDESKSSRPSLDDVDSAVMHEYSLWDMDAESEKEYREIFAKNKRYDDDGQIDDNDDNDDYDDDDGFVFDDDYGSNNKNNEDSNYTGDRHRFQTRGHQPRRNLEDTDSFDPRDAFELDDVDEEEDVFDLPPTTSPRRRSRSQPVKKDAGEAVKKRKGAYDPRSSVPVDRRGDLESDDEDGNDDEFKQPLTSRRRMRSVKRDVPEKTTKKSAYDRSSSELDSIDNVDKSERPLTSIRRPVKRDGRGKTNKKNAYDPPSSAEMDNAFELDDDDIDDKFERPRAARSRLQSDRTDGGEKRKKGTYDPRSSIQIPDIRLYDEADDVDWEKKYREANDLPDNEQQRDEDANDDEEEEEGKEGPEVNRGRRKLLESGTEHWGVVRGARRVGLMVQIPGIERDGMVPSVELTTKMLLEEFKAGMQVKVYVMQHTVERLELSVRRVRPELREDFQPFTLAIFGLPYDLYDDDISELLSPFGSVIHVDLINHDRPDRPDIRELAFVTFFSKEQAMACMKNFRRMPMEYGEDTLWYHIRCKQAKTQDFKRHLQEHVNAEHEQKLQMWDTPYYIRRKAEQVLRDVIPYYEDYVLDNDDFY
jgi:RNA recognition motif. (a.k.a. RRM, RBD, or RNP domain)